MHLGGQDEGSRLAVSEYEQWRECDTGGRLCMVTRTNFGAVGRFSLSSESVKTFQSQYTHIDMQPPVNTSTKPEPTAIRTNAYL